MIVFVLAAYIETLRLERDLAYRGEAKAKSELSTFKTQTAAIGEKAKRDAADQEAKDRARKEAADAENARTVAGLNAALVSLRAKRPSGSFVPAAPTGSSRPDLICFDRTEYQRADGVLTARARGLADEGTKATVDLNTAKHWAAP